MLFKQNPKSERDFNVSDINAESPRAEVKEGEISTADPMTESPARAEKVHSACARGDSRYFRAMLKLL